MTCGTVLPDDARFCPSCGTPVDGAPVPEDDLERAGEERKIVSVLFADLVGFTESSDGEDPEDVRSRLTPYHTALREEVERYGGRIEKLMGDGVLAVFGAPVAHEDDPERAVRAGLRIQESVGSLAGTTGLQARVAIATGEGVVQIEGTTMDREGLVGDVINTASRLEHEAPPGTVLVDEATHRSTHRMFRYEERPPVVVKGKSRPQAVWIALEPTGRIGTEYREHLGTTLVGRDTELSLLINAFTRAMDEETSQLVTIGGEPGVGKSRMVEELRRHIDDLPDLRPARKVVTYSRRARSISANHVMPRISVSPLTHPTERNLRVSKIRMAAAPLPKRCTKMSIKALALARSFAGTGTKSSSRVAWSTEWRRLPSATKITHTRVHRRTADEAAAAATTANCRAVTVAGSTRIPAATPSRR